jgi:predicted amino acid racemase
MRTGRLGLSDVSLNSEIEVIEALNEEARRQDTVHRIIIMIELGDLREGILPGSLVEFYEEIFPSKSLE